MNTKLVLCAFFTLTILIACSTSEKKKEEKSEITSAVNNINEAVNSLSSTLSTEIKSKPSVRRMEALKYYIAKGDMPTDQNFSSKKPEESFALFVCTGTGALRRELAALEYTNDYTDTLKEIASPSEDTFSGQFSKLLVLSGSVNKLSTPNTIKALDVFESCVKEIQSFFQNNFNGYPASDVTGEVAPLAIIAAISSISELVGYVEKLTKDGIKISNEVMISQQLKKFDSENRETLLTVLSNDLSEERLENSWARRKAASLYLPFETFKELLDLPRKKNTDKILRLGQLADAQLSTFDTLRTTPSPRNIVNKLRVVEENLHLVITDDKINLNRVISFIKSISEDFKTIQKDYEEIKTAWPPL
jgi:hypothetical protein